MYRGTQFDGLSERWMLDVTASKMHACERATPMRYKHLRCKSCERYASKMQAFEIRACERCMLVDLRL